MLWLFNNSQEGSRKNNILEVYIIRYKLGPIIDNISDFLLHDTKLIWTRWKEVEKLYLNKNNNINKKMFKIKVVKIKL